ncbi:hypothetical protein [Aquibacillus albus]|uniref:Uncharacterized protein n=1 Tax=Aquibacillus albus TaxID=1168171 RepID=A0ABS2MYC1_9BACI|nr:hypothetical protein [Aquibacillus albus]MBM7570839.1 hypothetical protein [Aquibacillus albus]
MKFTLIVILAILLITTFLLLKKSLHTLEIIFLFLLLEFLSTSYFAFLTINYEVWSVEQKKNLFIFFHLYKVIILPLLYLYYFHFYSLMTTRLKKLLLTLIAILAFLSTEYLLVEWDVIIYKDWNYWMSILGQAILLGLVFVLRLCFRSIMKKEGVVHS